MWKIEVADAAQIDIDEAAALYRSSTLAERRPVDRADVFTAMLRNASLIVTARLDERLIGISRSLTDFAYVTYLCDLAVDVAYQRRGVGRDLIQATREAAPTAKIVLLAAPDAVGYYPHMGFTRHESAWVRSALS